MSLVEVAVGDGAPERWFGPITRTDIVRYQGASGDMNPIHHDELFAKEAGFPTVFSVGMLQAGLLATYATDWLGAENVRRFSTRFREQVWPGDRLACSGVVEAIEPADDGTLLAHVKLDCRREGGGQAIDGAAVFVVARRNGPNGADRPDA
jgi:acyl dehydratase